MAIWNVKQSDIDDFTAKGFILKYYNAYSELETITSPVKITKSKIYITMLEGFNMEYIDIGYLSSVNGDFNVQLIWAFSLSGTNAYGEPQMVAPENLNSESTTGELNLASYYGNDYFYYKPEFTRSIESGGGEVLSSNNVYLVDDVSIKEINAERYTESISAGGIITNDYGKFINNIIQVPFTIKSEYLYDDESKVKLGDYETSVKVPQLKFDKLTLDFGVLEVPKINNNILDYKNVVYKLNLPYHDSITLEPSYVLDSELSVIYLVDLYSGATTINVSSSKIGLVFTSESTNLGVNVPYASPIDKSPENVNIDLLANNFILTPNVEVIVPEYKTDGLAIYPDSGLLGSYKGNVTVSKIDLNGVEYLEDVQRIETYLNSGVVIK